MLAEPASPRVVRGELCADPRAEVVEALRWARELLSRCSLTASDVAITAAYRQRVKDHINPFIGHLKLATMTTVDAQNFYESLLDQLRSRDMVRRVCVA